MGAGLAFWGSDLLFCMAIGGAELYLCALLTDRESGLPRHRMLYLKQGLAEQGDLRMGYVKTEDVIWSRNRSRVGMTTKSNQKHI